MIESCMAMIEEACKWAIEHGWTIAPGTWVDDTDAVCCPLGAVCLSASYPVSPESANLLLGLTLEQIGDFVSGFDSYVDAENMDSAPSPMFLEGRRLRSDFIAHDFYPCRTGLAVYPVHDFFGACRDDPSMLVLSLRHRALTAAFWRSCGLLPASYEELGRYL